MPGTCNIGREEIAKRYRYAIAALVVFVLYAVLIYIYSAERNWRLPIFIPAFLTVYCYLQGRLQFCAGLGLRGLSKIGKDVTIHSEHISRDRKRAVKILMYSFAAAAFVTAIVYYFPV